MRKIGKAIATLFFAGYFPVAPGTVASIIAVGLYLLVRQHTYLYNFLAVLFLVLGFWSAGIAKSNFKEKDPPHIVIDEFSAMFASYLFIPFSWKRLIIGFFLFRLFDIVKIPPLKRLESLPGARGIMLDDIAAAIITNVILQISVFFSFFSR